MSTSPYFLEIVALLIGATALLAGCFYWGYTRSRDPLHPVVFLAPLFFMGLVLEPLRALTHPDIHRFFPGLTGVTFALSLQYAGMATLFFGMLSITNSSVYHNYDRSLLDPLLTPTKRSQLRSLAWIITSFSLFGFWNGLDNVGGFTNAYSFSKGGGIATSGYLGESLNLGTAAIIIYALGCQRRPLQPLNFLAGLIMTLPMVIHGTLGGRRGFLFYSLSSLFVAYWIARGRTPRVWIIALTFIAFIFAIVFMQSQRQHVFIGSTESIQWQQFVDLIYGVQLNPGDNFPSSIGAAIVLNKTQKFHYGRRLLITYLIRPIPKQFWPEKYHDAILFLYGSGETYNSVANPWDQWRYILGWHPPKGWSLNAIVDCFLEFGWAYIFVTFALGRFIGYCWLRFRTTGGIWFVIYVTVISLSVYLPTQSFRAFLVRFLYVTLITAFFWNVYFTQIKARESSFRG